MLRMPLSLLPQVEREVLSQYESELLEKEHSGCAALLNDDKVRSGRLPPASWMLPVDTILQSRSMISAALSHTTWSGVHQQQQQHSGATVASA